MTPAAACALLELTDALQRAVVEGRWERAAELAAHRREQLTAMTMMPGDALSNATAEAVMRKLLARDEDISQCVQATREDMARRLMELRRARKAARLYADQATA